MFWPLSPRRAVDGDLKWWKAPIMRIWRSTSLIIIVLKVASSFHGAVDMILNVDISTVCLCWICSPTRMIGREGSVVHESRWQEGHYISISLSGRQSQYKHGKPEVISIQHCEVSFAWIWIFISAHELVQNKVVWHRDPGWGGAWHSSMYNMATKLCVVHCTMCSTIQHICAGWSCQKILQLYLFDSKL